MKTSLKRLLHHHNRKHRHGHGHGHGRSSSKDKDKDNDKETQHIQPLAQLDDLAKASQEMEDMKDCYDSLLSAAAAAANSAYEFSDSLREMGVCLLQKIAVNDDEETGKVMLMLGKVQFELQKLVDNYRSHIFQTITVPSDSLVNELHNLQERKHQCYEKKELYEYMRARHRERGKPRSGNGESFSSEQILAAKDEFDEEATLFVFRLKSLKQGQSRSLLTQAARHHAAQLSLFMKAIKTLEAVEPHVKLATQQQHIDYQLSGLDVDGVDDEDDDDDDRSEDDEDSDGDDEDSDEDDGSCSSSNEGADKELSFDYRRDHPWPKLLAASRNNLEVENMKLSYRESVVTDPKMLSRSAPLLPQQKVDTTDRITQLRPSPSRKVYSYVLPKPGDPKSSISTAPGCDNFNIPVSKSSPQLSRTLFHSCPLEPQKNDKVQNLKSVNDNCKTPPPPLTDKFPSHHWNHHDLSSTTGKPKPQFFSGPLISKPFSAGQSLSSNNPRISKEPPLFSSGPLLRSSIQRSTNSPKASPVHSPTFNSSPRISELHELPRPPPARSLHTPSKSSGFCAPSNLTKKTLMRNPASRLPTPLIRTASSSPRVERSSSPCSRQQHDDDHSASPPVTPLGLPKLLTK